MNEKMIQFHKNIPLILLIITSFHASHIRCQNENQINKIPIAIWSINNDHVNLSPLSSSQSFTDDVYPEDILNLYFGSKMDKIAFVQKDINIEQFSHSNLPYLSKFFDEDQAMFFPYSTYEPEFYKSNFNSIIPLPENSLEKNEPIIRSYVEKFNKTNKNPTIFVLTGEKNSKFDEINESNRIRVRRATDDNNKVKKEPLKFSNGTDKCAFMFVNKIHLKSNKDEKIQNFELNDLKPSKTVCLNDTDGGKVKEIKASSIEFKMSDKYTVNISFHHHESKWWRIKTIKLTNGSNTWTSKNIKSESENGFSYSCSRKSYRLFENNSDPEQEFYDITFKRFQIQPFVLEDNKLKFEDSFDCSQWVTLPILSSLMVCLLLILILYCGIRAVLSISTPDRFENPKSKGLILGAVDE